MTKAKDNFIVTPEFRLSFPALFTPVQYETGQPKYEITMLFPKDVDINELKALAKAAAVERWGADPSQWPPGLRVPFKDGDAPNTMGKIYDTHRGHIVVKASSLYAPGVVNESVQPVINEKEVYSGCYCRAQINAYTYANKGNCGVSFGLANIQKLRDGDRIGGGPSATAAFDAVAPSPGNSGNEAFFEGQATGTDGLPF